MGSFNSHEEVIKAKDEAIKRVCDMQERCKKKLEQPQQFKIPRFNSQRARAPAHMRPQDFHKKQHTNNHHQCPPKSPCEEPKENCTDKAIPNHEKHKTPGNKNPQGILEGFPNILDAIFKDEEKSLILTLMIILMGEEENLAILLALIYIL